MSEAASLRAEPGAPRLLSGRTRVVGVFGDPVEHSLSPAMQNAALAALGLDWVYVPFHVKPAELPTAVRAIVSLGLVGVNVTVPHKVAVMDLLDEVDEEARLIGAVNTIVNRDGRLVGYNTDGLGFLQSLEEQAGRDPRGAEILVLGAGGAAQAIACSMAMRGAARVTIANRSLAKAQALAERIRPYAPAEWTSLSTDDPAFLKALRRAEIIVHTTTVGMHPHDDQPPIVPAELLEPSALVCDIVYRPRETTLIQAARARGCPVLTGEGMLAYQGAVALRLWTEMEPPATVMLATLTAQLAERPSERP